MTWKTLLALVALASVDALPDAGGIRSNQPASGLEVTLVSPVTDGSAEVTAIIKNTGQFNLNLLKVGTILDDELPVQRLTVTDDAGNPVPFKGIEPSIRYDALKPKHFQLLAAGSSMSIVIDAGKVHQFEKSGTFSAIAEGVIPLALAPSTDLSRPSAAFRSNTVTFEVDAVTAGKSFIAAGLVERTNLQPGCNATTLNATVKALANCQTLALASAADAADPSSKRFVEYFGTNSSETRNIVVTRLRNVAQECSSTDSGATRFFCYDYYGICDVDGPLNAYTAWDVNTMVMCPLFYGLPPLPPGCHRQSQATTAIHETTHNPGVYQPYTQDYAYGYNASVALPPDRALQNADNYALYATAVYLHC